MGCPILGACHCNGMNMCVFCKTIIVVIIGILSGILGYRIGKRTNCKTK
jgi:hypothetical protein